MSDDWERSEPTNGSVGRCKWNGSAQPRTVPGRHDGACQDEACPGCAILRRILARRSIDRGHTTPCWISTYHLDGAGYAKIKLRPDPINRAVHRVAYELLVGPIGDGLVIDHLCRVPACFNPDHLEPVTTQVNILRGVGFSAAHARQTHCVNGHEFNAQNTTTRSRIEGGRECRPCNTNRKRSVPPEEGAA